MKSTQAMRDRIRELAHSDDYDRAVICVLDDLEALFAAPKNETSRDWAVCRAVDAYRAPRSEADERTLADFLEEIGLILCPLAQAQEPGEDKTAKFEEPAYRRKSWFDDDAPPPQVDSGRGPTAEDIYACAESTLIGFRDELTEDQIKFICDQISRKATMRDASGGRE